MNRSIVFSTIIAMAVGVQAETISLNFVGGDLLNGTLSAGDQAGMTGSELGNTLGSTLKGNWNNLAGATGSNVGGLTHSGGSVVDGVTVSWTADNVYQLPNTTGGSNGSANTTMMKGYLDTGFENTTTVTLSGLQPSAGTYSVIVYIDGDNAAEWKRANYSIGATTVLNEDSEGVDFNSGSGNNANGLFQIPDGSTAVGNTDWPFDPNNSEGNAIIFSGLTASSFSLTADPINSGSGSLFRAPINGIQIVGVIPEPATFGLMALFGGGTFLLRRIFMI